MLKILRSAIYLGALLRFTCFLLAELSLSSLQLAAMLVQLSLIRLSLLTRLGELTFLLGQRGLLLLQCGLPLGDFLLSCLDLLGPSNEGGELLVVTTVQTAQTLDLRLNACEDVEDFIARSPIDLVQRLAIGAGP